MPRLTFPTRATPPRGASATGGAGRASTLWILRIVVLALAVRVFTAGIAFYANVVVPPFQREQFTISGTTDKFWDTFARWDSGWYYGIASKGYRFVEGGRSNLAFFPAFPIAMRYAGLALGGGMEDYYRGGIVVSWLAFLGAMVGLALLARLDLDEAGAERAVLHCMVFPFAFFFGLVYSESTFLCGLVWAIYGMRTQRWWLAALAGALVVCARVNGIVSVPAIAWIGWVAAGRDRTQRINAGLAVLAMVAAFVLWCAYVYWLSGSFLEWKASIERWGYYPGGHPWTPVGRFVHAMLTRPGEHLMSGGLAPYDAFNAVMALLFVAATPFVWWRLGAGYALLVAINLALPLSSGQFEGLGRYCSVLFPVFVWMGTWTSPRPQQYALAASGGLYILALSLFTTIHPLW
ncbi:MAG: hypothetical protein JNM38_19830 [Acidobacteria bacterium]|jgi:hypothetical protein|nr:hypothetical protein [Acidobacteriota bacterium]